MNVNNTSSLIGGFIAAVALIHSVDNARAQDASFGCKVLLCSAATSPSWSGIPYCVPVMQKLFHDLAKGRPWPSCPEGGTQGPIRYEPYLPCPSGTTPGTMASFGGKDGGGGGFTATGQGELCGKQVRIPGSVKDGGASTQYVTSPRPKRPDPYSIVITPKGGQPTTLWFSL